MRRIWIVVIPLSTLVCTAPGQTGGSQGDAAFDAWWQRLTANGRNGPVIDGVRLEYRVDQKFTPDAAQMTALRQAVSNHPEHPDRGILETYERRLANPGSESYVCTIWRFGPMWRWSMHSADNSTFHDSIWGDGIAWQLTPSSLTIVDQAHIQDTRYRIDVAGSASAADVDWILTAHVGSAAGSGLDLRPTVLPDGRWSVRGQRGEVTFQAEGMWRATDGWGTVDRSTWINSPADKPQTGLRVETAEWSTAPGLRMGVPKTVRVMKLDGRADREFTLQEATSFTKRDFERIITVPDIDGKDAVRGAVTFSSVVDLRGGGQRIRSVDLADRTVTRPIVEDTTSVDREWLRTAGWVIAASLIALFVTLRLRRVPKG